MTCAELQRELPDILDSTFTVEQQAHIKYCRYCSDLLADLNTISEQARFLRDAEEPSPRVWNAIEIALRQEGIIHEAEEPRRGLAIVHRSPRRWNRAWLIPLAAALAVAFGVARHERLTARMEVAQSTAPAAASLPPAAPQSARFTAADDEQLLEVVSSRLPTMRASYEADLRNVNAYIRDAELSARSNPNDEEAQQYLMNAYEEKAMVYNMALERSEP